GTLETQTTSSTTETQTSTSISGIGISAACGASITACCDITSSGMYTVANAITNTSTCIAISASDVDLDCLGNTITYATTTSGSAITSGSNSHVRIQNCTITKGDINTAGSAGILLSTATNVTIANVTITVSGGATSPGIELNSAVRSIIENSTVFSNNSQGILLASSSNDNTISNTSSSSNVSTAISISSGNNNTIRNSTGRSSSLGIHLSSANNTISNSSAYGGSAQALFLQSDNNQVFNTYIAAGSLHGFLVSGSYHRVSGNHVVSSAGPGALQLSSVTYSNITNNFVNSSGGIPLQVDVSANHNYLAYNYGLSTSSSTGILNEINTNNTFFNNTGQSSIGAGVTLSNTDNNTFINTTAITSSGDGLFLQDTAGNTLINTTIIKTSGGTAIRFTGSLHLTENNTFANTVIQTNSTWITSDANSNFNNFTNTTYDNGPSGNIFIANQTQLPNVTTVSQAKLATSTNLSFLNSANLTFLNTSANITLRGLAFSNPQPLVDFEDDGSFVACGPGQCTKTSYSGGVFTMNVSSFTSYAVSETTVACGDTITTDTTLAQNLTGTGSCLTIGADNVVLDCAGNIIEYNTGGGNYSNAIQANGRTNITVRNCIIRDTNESGQWGWALNMTNVDNSFIVNNTIQTNGTRSNYGINFQTGSTSNSIHNNTVRTNGTDISNWGIIINSGDNNNITDNIVRVGHDADNYGIYLVSNSDNNIVQNNSVFTYGDGSGNIGIRAEQTVTGNRFINNSVTTTSGSIVDEGIRIETGASNNLIENNTIQTQDSAGIFLGSTSTNNNVRYNIINSTQLYGILLQSADSNNLTGNSIASGSHGIFLFSGTNNRIENTYFDNNLNWLSLNAGALGNFTNSTFRTPNGFILITSAEASGPLTLSRTNLNISSNRAFLNSTNASAFNSSAQINLSGIAFTDPRPRVDFEDDGTFVNCEEPQCTEISYSGGTYVFNVSSFTTYISAENTTACGDTLMADTNLTQNLSGTGSCLTIGADNVMLDCAGYTINYSSSTAGIAINSTNRNNVTIRNCNIGQTTALANSDAVHLRANNNSYVINTSIITLGDTTTSSVRVFLGTHNNITNLSITALSGKGLWIDTSTQNNISLNVIRANDSPGIQISGNGNRAFNNSISSSSSQSILISASGTTILNNSLSSTTSNGIQIGGSNNLIEDNVAVSGSSAAIFLASTTDNTVIRNRAVSGTQPGIQLNIALRNQILHNTANTTSQFAIFLSQGSNNNLFGNNTGNATNGVGMGISASHNNTIQNSTARANTGAGFQINSGENNTFFNNTFESSTSNALILVGGNFNNYTNSTISSNSGPAILIQGGGNNTFTNTSALSNTNAALALTGGQNNTFIETRLFTNRTWLTAGATSTGNTINNTLFDAGVNGSIFILNATVATSSFVGINNLTVIQNRAFLNSTNVPFLNASAQITLNGITQNQAQQIVDFEDDGSYIPCVEPDCTFISYDGSTLVFNVSHFTSFSSTQGGVNVTLEKTDNPDPVNLSQDTLLNYTINFTVTDGAAFNITINETYPDDVDFITSNPLPTTGNFSWDAGNLSIGSNYEINITINVSSSLPNGYVINNTINATYQNSSGDALFVNVTENTTITAVNQPPVIGQVILNSSRGSGEFGNATTRENLSILLVNVTDGNSDEVKNITQWLVDGTNQLLLNLPFENASGNTTREYAQNFTPISVDGATFLANGGIDGFGAYSFDGLNDRITIGTINGANTALNSNQQTISFWFKTGSTTPPSPIAEYIYERQDGPGFDDFQGVRIAVLNGTGRIAYFVTAENTSSPLGTGTNANIIGPPVNDTLWHHLVATLDFTFGDRMDIQLYLDGQLVGENGTEIVDGVFPNEAITLGDNVANAAAGEEFFGTIDDFMLWRRALSSEQAALLYENSSLISHEETFVGETWRIEAVPLDGSDAGASTFSNNVTILAECPLNLTSSTTLSENQTCPATAINILADNVELDCAGYAINYSSTGTGFGINASGRNNITVRNCEIAKTNGSVTNAHGISFVNTENSTILNTTAVVNAGSGSAVSLTTSSNITLTNLSLRSNTSAALFISGGTNYTLSNSLIVVNGTSNAFATGTTPQRLFISNNSFIGYTSVSEALQISLHNSTFRNNTAYTLPSISAFSAILSGGDNVIDRSHFESGPSGSSNAASITFYNSFIENSTFVSRTAHGLGIGSASRNNTFENITLSAPNGGGFTLEGREDTIRRFFATSTSPLTLSASSGNSIFDGILNLSGISGGMGFFSTSENNTVDNVTLNGGAGSSTWIQSISSANNTISNTTINRTFGSITFINQTTVPATTLATTTNLTVLSNQAFLNTNTLGFLNTTAQITLNGLSSGTIQPIADYDDNGRYIACTAPECTFISYNGSTFVFNVSHFTSFSSTTGGVSATLTKTDSSDPIDLTNSTLLNYTIVFNATSGVAHNTTINETYPSEVSFVSANPAPTTGNFSWAAGNLFNTTYNITIQVNVSNLLADGYVINNTINATYQNSSGDSLFVNVTENTTVANQLCPLEITTNTTLTQNITCPATAVNILADNVVLDCAEYTVLYANSSSGYGINASGRNNITVQNCTVRQAGAIVDSHAIVLRSSNNSKSLNNSATASIGGNSGIRLESAHNNTIENNTAYGNTSAGIFLTSSSDNIVRNNTAGDVGPGSGGISTQDGNNNLIERNSAASPLTNGISVSTGTGNTVVNNTAYSGNNQALSIVTTLSTTIANNTARSDSGFGIELYDSNFSSVRNNRFFSDSGSAFVIDGGSADNNLSDNIATSNANTAGYLSDADRNTFTNNTFTGNSSALVLESITTQNRFANTSLQTNGTWISTEAASIGNSILNTSFNSPAGTILIASNVTVLAPASVTLSTLNITLNRAFLNSTNLSFLNTSAQITLNGLSTGTVQPIADFEDDGTFIACTSPQCEFVSYTGGTFVFNVSSFTTYSTTDGGVALTLTKTDNPDPIDLGVSTILNYTITVNVTSGVAHNLTINETYPVNVSFVMSSPAPTAGNGTWNAGNISNGTVYQINITLNVSNLNSNGTVLVNTINATYQNSTGAALFVNVTENTTVIGCIIIASTVSGSTITNCTLNQSAAVNSTIDNSTLDNSSSTGSTINSTTLANTSTQNSTIINSTKLNSTIINSSVTTSTNANCSLSNTSESASSCTDSTLADSTILNSTVTDSTLTGTTAANSTITGSNITNSSLTNSTVTDSNITGSILANATVTNSSVIDSNVTDSNVTDSNVTNSTITNSTITNATVINMTVINATISGDACTNGTIIYNGQTFPCPANLSAIIAGTPPAPAPAVTGGGGGGGAGASAVSTTTSFTQNQLTQNFRRNDRITFTVNNELHTMTILEVTTQSVTIEIASTPEVYTLLRGQTRAIDATDDGIPDISVRVIDI
ncbi:hypothetical protein C4580_01100, partial [Candidatus Woesearchaeota archaeon]